MVHGFNVKFKEEVGYITDTITVGRLPPLLSLTNWEYTVNKFTINSQNKQINKH